MVAVKRSTFVLLSALVIFVSGGSTAFAHAEYESSSPADGATVASPPQEVWAEFTEPPMEGSYLLVYDPCGERVDSGSYSYLAKRITVSVAADKAGAYTVQWRVQSDLDGHPTAGDFGFTVTGGNACPSDEPAEEEGDDGNGGSGGGGSEDPGTAQDASSDQADQADQTDQMAGKDPAEKPKKGSKQARHNKHQRNDRKDRVSEEDDRTIELVSGGDPLPDDPAGGELPLDWLLISFVIAAFIGAVGGQIYVNLTGASRK